MALGDPIPVRFSGHTDEGLSSVCARAGLSKAELIRIAVDEFLEKTERTGEIVQRHRVAAQTSVGHGNTLNHTTNFSSAPSVPAPAEPSKSKPSKRGRKKKPHEK